MKGKGFLIWGSVALVIAPMITIPILMLVAAAWLCIYLSKGTQRRQDQLNAHITHLANEGRHWL